MDSVTIFYSTPFVLLLPGSFTLTGALSLQLDINEVYSIKTVNGTQVFGFNKCLELTFVYSSPPFNIIRCNDFYVCNSIIKSDRSRMFT